MRNVGERVNPIGARGYPEFEVMMDRIGIGRGVESIEDPEVRLLGITGDGTQEIAIGCNAETLAVGVGDIHPTDSSCQEDGGGIIGGAAIDPGVIETGDSERAGARGETIPGDGIGVRGQCPVHPQRSHRMWDRIRACCIGFQGCLYKHRAVGIDGVAEMEKAGELGHGIFCPDDDHLAAGTGGEELEMGWGGEGGAEAFAVGDERLAVNRVMPDPARFLVEGQVERRGADPKEIVAVGELELAGGGDADIAAPGGPLKSLGGQGRGGRGLDAGLGAVGAAGLRGVLYFQVGLFTLGQCRKGKVKGARMTRQKGQAGDDPFPADLAIDKHLPAQRYIGIVF